jgi:hypothetical protein
LSLITNKWSIMTIPQAKKLEESIKPMDSRWYLPKYASNQSSRKLPEDNPQKSGNNPAMESLSPSFRSKLDEFTKLAEEFDERLKNAGNSAIEEEERNAYLNKLRDLFGKRETWSFGGVIVDVELNSGNYVAKIDTQSQLDLFRQACLSHKHIPMPTSERHLMLEVTRDQAKQFARNAKVIVEGTVFHESTPQNFSTARRNPKFKMLVQFDASSALFITDYSIQLTPDKP